MSHVATLTSRARAAALVVALAAAALFVFPGTASAGVVGAYQPAQVQCDRMSNKVDITPSVAISTSYSRQRVAYQLAIYSATTRTWLTTPNPSQWFVFDHNGWQWTQVFSEYGTTGQWTYNPQVPARTYTYYPTAGAYYVYTRYLWEAPLDSGTWYDVNGQRFSASSPWTLTQSYTNYGDWSPSSSCKVRV